MSAELRRLVLSNIRNLAAVDLNFGPKFNVFIGPNGSGKTSLLEAVHLLGVGRSFRARSAQQIISFGQNMCLVRAKVNDTWLAMSKNLSGSGEYRVGEQVGASVAELNRLLPIQLVDVNSHLLLEGGPNFRRQFVDWGVFHVEHTFLESWRMMHRALLQRNSLLKQRKRPPVAWDETFIRYALAVGVAREKYLEGFRQEFLPILQKFMRIGSVELRYKPGWQEDSLVIALEQAAQQDLATGFTNRGPHRADLEVLVDGRAAKSVLSRGQTKLFVCLMLLARARLLKNNKDSVFLIDDLHAELDRDSCDLFLKAIDALECQVFITGIEEELIRARLKGYKTNMFHVEQGCIRSGN